MKMTMNKKRKGFTLVEMLIVIIIIGILAGTMMMTMGSGTAKAEASKIVSDLRTLKGACLMYYTDTDTWPSTSADPQGLRPYVGEKNMTHYQTVETGGGTLGHGPLYVFRAVSDDNVKDALRRMARESVLLRVAGSADTANYYDGAAENVFMRVK